MTDPIDTQLNLCNLWNDHATKYAELARHHRQLGDTAFADRCDQYAADYRGRRDRAIIGAVKLVGVEWRMDLAAGLERGVS